jgi:FkbM family methyltransferase
MLPPPVRPDSRSPIEQAAGRVATSEYEFTFVPTRQNGMIINTVVDGHDIRFFVANPQDEIQKYHLEGQFQEIEELKVIKAYSRTGRVFVDVGSNVGNHTIFVSKLLDYAKILVFEPNPRAISILRINLLLNRCDNVDSRYLGIALGAAARRARIFQPHPNNLGGTTLIEDPIGDTVTLPGDQLLSSEDVGFIKIDVEGMEMDILSGLSETIRRSRPCIFIEVWPDREDKFAEWCGDHGYEIKTQVPHRWGRVNYTNYMIAPR